MTPTDARQEYTRASLDERDVDRDPIRQFLAWLDQANEALDALRHGRLQGAAVIIP